MDRLKELGTWVVLVIAFWLFSNGMIYLFLSAPENTQNNIVNNNSQIVQKK